MTKKSIIKSAAMLAAAGIISKVLGAIYRIPLGNILGAGGMGNYQLAHPIYTMLLLACTAGISVAVARMVAEKIAKSAPAEWQRSIKKYCENTNLCQVNGKYETSM